MVKKFIASLLCVSAMLSVTACSINIGGTELEFGSKKSDSSEETTTAKLTKPELVTEPQTEPIVLEPLDYYCIADDVKITNQMHDHGTCWAFAAASAMETAAAVRNGKTISIDPHELIDAVFQTDKKDGYFVDEDIDPLDAGGNSEMIISAVSNGFGSYVLEDAEYIQSDSLSDIRDAVRLYGGLTACVPVTDGCEGEFDGKLTYNEPDAYDYCHLVTVIGFDDNFPKENFTIPAAENGAWIVRNSSVADERYYISYETPLESVIGLSLTEGYSQVLGYDAGNIGSAFVYLQTGDATTAANVFHQAGTLAAVGTYSVTPDQTVKIEVRTDDLKNVLYAQEAHFVNAGYHIVELAKPLEVEDYAISISYPDGVPVECETTTVGESKYKVFSKLGVSFLKCGREWVDMCDEEAFKQTGLGFTPNNCCIKALYK